MPGFFKSIFGRSLGLDDLDRIVAPGGLAAGGGVGVGDPNYAALTDDFIPMNIAADTALAGTFFNYREGTDTGWTGLVSATLPHGVFNITPDAVVLAGSAAPTHGAGIVGKAVWKAGMGPGNKGLLRLVARIKIATVSRNAPDRKIVFVGFTDNTAYELPIYDTGAGPISAAADAVGFVLGSRTDTGWNGYAVKSTPNDSGDQQVVLGRAPVSNKWTTLRLDVVRGTGDTGGKAYFYVDDELRGSIDSPIATDTPMAPAIYTMMEDTGLSGAAGVLGIDLVHVGGTRDTGD